MVEKDQLDEQNRPDEPDKPQTKRAAFFNSPQAKKGVGEESEWLVPEGLGGFCQQDARDVEVGEHHLRGSIEGLVVGALESVALD